MSNRTARRSLTATLSGPLVAAGIIVGSMVIGDPASASAQPVTDGQRSSMPMTSGQDLTAPNALTRAGQVGADAGPSASDGSMMVDCRPAGHS